MDDKYEIDSIDKQILSILLNDARTPFIEIARKLIVSGGTVHQRVEKMKTAGIIEGSQITLNLKNLGFDVTVFIGVHLKSSKELSEVITKLKAMPEVLEAHYTTGNYALLLKICTRSTSDFHKFLVEKLQPIDQVQSTESFLSLDQPIRNRVVI